MLRDNWLKWFERRIQLGRLSSRRRRSGKRIEARAACIAEALEQRTLLTTFTVDNLTDESDGNFGPGDQSLREAIQRANANPGADIVTFAPGLGGSVINLTLGNLTVNDDLTITGFTNPVVINNGGLVLQSSGATDTLVFSMSGLAVNNNVLGPGLLIESINDGFVTANISNSFFNNSAREGIKVRTHTGGDANLTLNGVDVNSNGDTIASAGISVEVGVTAQAQSLTFPGQFATVRLNMTDVEVRNNKLEGLDVNVATGGQFVTTNPITDTIFAGNGVASARNEVDLTASGLNSSIEARFENVTADNSQANGFNAVATAGANIALVVNNSSATNAASDAINVLATGVDSSAAVSVTNFNGDNAGVFGADIDSTAGAEVRVNNFNNVSLQNAGRSGLDVYLLNGDITAFNAANVNLSGNMQNGLNLFLRNGSSVFTFNGLTADNNVERGIQITSIVNANTSVTMNNVSSQGNQTKQPLSFVVNNNATLNLDVNGGTISSFGTDPNNSIFGVVAQNSTGNLSFDGLTVNNSTSSAFVTRYDSASKGNFEITNTTATGSQAVGVALFVKNNADITGNFNGLNVSNAGQGITADGVRVDVNGQGTTANLSFNNVTADGASKRGIGIQYANKATGSVTQFDGISAQNATQDGVVIEARGLAKLNAFNGNGINVTGAGQSGNIAHDGLEIGLLGSNVPGTTASVNLDNVTASGAAGRGINVSVQNKIVADLNIDGFTANSNGLEGVNLVVGTITTGAVLQNSGFTNGTASNNGTTVAASGFRTRVTGGGTSADVNLSNVDANSNSLNGIDSLVNAGADLMLGVEGGSSANNNFIGGLRFIADGPTTKAALTATTAGNTFNGNNDNGAFVQLTNGVTVSDLTILGGASNNNENGIHVDADDLSGVTINNFQIGGAGSSFANNDETGLLVDLDSVLGMGDFVINGISASGNMGLTTGVGANVMLANMTLDNVSTTNVTATGNNTDGLRVTLDGVTINEDLNFTGFNTTANKADGAELVLLNGTTVTDTLSLNGTSTGNTGTGLKVTANDASGVSIGTLNVTGSSVNVNNNSGNGLTVDFDTVAGITSFDLSDMVITGNAGDQVKATFANMVDPIAINFNDATATGPGGGGGTGDGIDLTLDNTTATTLQLDRINASNNNGDGLKLSLLGGAVIPATSIDVGTFNDNGANGIDLVLTDSTASIDITNSTFDLLGTIASASDNGANGLLVLLDNADLTMNTVDQIIFDGNGGTGITIQGATPSNFTSGGSFTNNTITNNGSFGYRAIFNGGDFDISLGSRTTPGEGNLIDNNTGAGVLLEMLQNSTGRMAIIDNTITNTNDGTGVFNGDGIFVRMLGTANPAQATNTLIDTTVPGVTPGLLIRDNTIGGTDAGNAGTGINFEVKEKSTLDGVDILNNTSNNNGIDGLNFKRFDQVTVNRLVASGNSFNSNGDDGVEVIAQNNDASAMDLTLNGNTMNGNANDGTVLGVNADAKLNVNVSSNTMSNNLDDGLDMIEVALDVDDKRAIFGSISDNNISNNTDLGINAGAFMGVTVGMVLTPLSIFDNTVGAQLDQFGQVVIDGNGSTGIFITGGGDSVWTNNDIIRNGRLVTADRTVGHGIDIENDFFGFYEKHVTLDSNRIRENFQDGIEYSNDGLSSDPNFAFFFNTNQFVEMIDNRVQDNVGRGVDILNQRLAGTFFTMRSSNPADPTKGNFINSNGEEGVYAVNTASATQNQDVFAADTLMMDGSVTIANPRLALTIDSSTVSNNGSPDNVPGMVQSAGIVVRVGSAGQGSLFGDSSFDFATSGIGPNSGFIPPAVVSAPVIPFFENPGVYLQVTNSTMQGNFGDDAYFHGFTSTVNPTNIGGTWSDTMFTPSGGQGDPLARLDVVWGTAAAGNDNTFDTIEVNNQFFLGIPSTPKGEAGAFYNNSDGVFKSRLSDATPPGPFSPSGPGAARARNAQRVAERIYPGGFTLQPTTSPDAGSFLFPGMGDSTFRVYAGGDTAVAAEAISDGFEFDDDPAGGDFSPIEGPFDIGFGTGFSSANPGGQPFAWGTY